MLGGMASNADDLAGRCVARYGGGATLLCPLAMALGPRLPGPYHAQALLTLALTLAKRDLPSLNGADVMADGSLKGLLPATPSADLAHVVSHALRLCVTNFGEDETGRLLAEAWPELR